MNIKKAAAVALSVWLMAGAAAADPLPLKEANEVKGMFAANPRAVKDIGDPFVLAQDGHYAVFATGGPIGFNVWQSDDLIKFDKSKAVKKISWASGDYWAPEVFPWQGKYVMFFTARMASNGSLRIGVAVADAPEGPYTDPLEAPLFDFGYAAIDGTMVTDDDGAPYLIYSRDCSENQVEGRNESHLYGVRLAEDLLSTVGEPVLLTRPDHDWETASGDYRWNEGPAVVKHNGLYYLYYSANYYADKAYSIGVAVAEHPLGPYVKQANNPILTWVEQNDKVTVSGPGHNAFFTVGDELFTAYHTHTYPQNPSGNRQLNIDRAGFHADGTAYINGPTLAPQLRPLAELGLDDLTRSAIPEDAASALLTDGDTCQAASSAGYVWHGSRASFTWAAPVSAQMILIWAPQSTAVSGRVILNGSDELPFSLSESRKAGEAAVLAFDALNISSMTLELDCEGSLGEVMVIGTGKE